MEKRKRNYQYLKAYPRISGVNSIYNIGFLEKRAGKKDAQDNQICQLQGGHITPYIGNKARLYDSYIDKLYLRTSLNMEMIVREAYALVVELNLINKMVISTKAGNSEEEQRRAALAVVKKEKNDERKAEIIIRIAEIKAESNMVDESLKHHIERAEGIFFARINKYWRGVLASTSEELEHFPYIDQREYAGRTAYLENRKELIAMIEKAVSNGGGSDEINEE